MEREAPQPRLSGTKQKQTTLFTTHKVADHFEDFSELDGDNDDVHYPVRDLDKF